jgi:hypothetical protein
MSWTTTTTPSHDGWPTPRFPGYAPPTVSEWTQQQPVRDPPRLTATDDDRKAAKPGGIRGDKDNPRQIGVPVYNGELMSADQRKAFEHYVEGFAWMWKHATTDDTRPLLHRCLVKFHPKTGEPYV